MTQTNDDFRAKARAAEAAMRPVFPPTPLLRNVHLSDRFGADIWLKREDLSPVRSYKLRGAFNAMRKLPEQKLFVCASAGKTGNNKNSSKNRPIRFIKPNFHQRFRRFARFLIFSICEIFDPKS